MRYVRERNPLEWTAGWQVEWNLHDCSWGSLQLYRPKGSYTLTVSHNARTYVEADIGSSLRLDA